MTLCGAGLSDLSYMYQIQRTVCSVQGNYNEELAMTSGSLWNSIMVEAKPVGSLDNVYTGCPQSRVSSSKHVCVVECKLLWSQSLIFTSD